MDQPLPTAVEQLKQAVELLSHRVDLLYGQAAQMAAQFQGAPGALQKPSLAYLGLILLVFAVVVNVIARLIVQRGKLKDTDATLTEAEAL